MCTMALQRAFGEEQLSAVEAEVMGDNVRSLALHEALGFQSFNLVESEYRNADGDPVVRHQLVLMASFWLRRQAPVA